MIKALKNVKPFNLRTKIVNILMFNGKKNTGEIMVLKFVKKLQKSNSKSFKKLIQLSIINSASAFKLNEQIVKKGKRKSIRSMPSFIASDSHRIMIALKLIKRTILKNKNFNSSYENFVYEVLSASSMKGHSVDKKTELQKQILANKRYVSKFRW